jgi:hypothetical protein
MSGSVDLGSVPRLRFSWAPSSKVSYALNFEGAPLRAVTRKSPLELYQPT